MNLSCSLCGRDGVEKLMEVETENDKYYYCKGCVKIGIENLGMKIFLNKNERSLLKQMKKFLKERVN